MTAGGDCCRYNSPTNLELKFGVVVVEHLCMLQAQQIIAVPVLVNSVYLMNG